MVNLRLAAAVAVTSLFFIVGCGDKATGAGDSGLNPNAGALTSHSGNNTPVKDSVSAAKVGAIIQEQANAAVSKVFETMGDGLSKRTSSTQKGTIESSINGKNSGTATVKGDYTASQTSAVVNVVCTFSDYSDDGDIFLGGQMSFDIKMTSDQTGENTSMKFTITGNIKFNGAYIGTNTFTIDADINDESDEESFTYTSTIVSDGVTTTIHLTNP